MPITDGPSADRWQDDINVTVLTGELARDPELYRTPNGLAVANLRLASSDTRTSPTGPVKHTNYVEIKVFERDAERCCEHLRKGSRVTVHGRLDYHEWTDQDGATRSGLRVLADAVRFGARFGRRPSAGSARHAQPRARASAAPEQPAGPQAAERGIAHPRHSGAGDGDFPF